MGKPGQRETNISSPSSLPRRVSAAGLEEALEISPDALLIINQAETIVMANEQVAALFGYRREELYELQLEVLLPHYLNIAHLNQWEPYFSAPHLQTMGSGPHQRGRRKDGSEFPLDISLRAVLVEDDLLIISTIRDMSEQRRAERERAQQLEHICQQAHMLELSHTEQRRLELTVQDLQAHHAQSSAHLLLLQKIIDALPNSVSLVYGEDARLLFSNRAAASLWGAEWHSDQPLEEFLTNNNISVTNIQGHPVTAQELAMPHAARQGATTKYQQGTIHRLTGPSLPVLVNAVPLDSSQGWHLLRQTTDAQGSAQPVLTESVMLVTYQDVSTLKENEYLKDEFIGIAAHELRNLMAILKGFTSMLVYQTARGKGVELPEWQREALYEIKEVTVRMDKLTGDLLDVTRLQAGNQALSRKPTDLVALTQHIMAQWQMTTERHVISLDTTFSSLVLEIDRVLIEQVLSNLLSNAIKYSAEGGPIELAIREEKEPHAILLSIRDHGIGIPARQQTRIFGRFVRAENARASEITGTGLGLYLSRELVERHRGRLWFESSEGIGSTFFMRLPY